MKKNLIAFILLFASSVAWSADTSIKKAHLDVSSMPKKILLIEPEIYVKELSVGGVAEKVDEWSVQANKNVRSALAYQISARRLFDKLDLPESLSAEEVASLDEHVALYDVVGFNAFYYGRAEFDAWKHKRTEFDYTLGSGLKVLGEKTGADAALFIVGEDYISSGGRKAARVFAALFGVVIPASPTFLSAALVDLKTGDILWMNYGTALDSKDLRKPEDVNKMMNEMFLNYPGRVDTAVNQAGI
jgi:hypothetical protein